MASVRPEPVLKVCMNTRFHGGQQIVAVKRVNVRNRFGSRGSDEVEKHARRRRLDTSVRHYCREGRKILQKQEKHDRDFMSQLILTPKFISEHDRDQLT